MLRTTRASSDIRLGSQGGSQTTLTSTFPLPARSNCVLHHYRHFLRRGQLGEVSDMSTFTVWSSAISMR